VREMLEPEAAALACTHIPQVEIAAVRAETNALLTLDPYDVEQHWKSDRNLHDLFIARCGNDVLIKLVSELRITTHLFEIARLSDRLGPDANEHLAILDALEAADAKAARKAVQAHIRSLYRFAIETLT
jgi:DNA-binding GntR family transcriptional regulator